MSGRYLIKGGIVLTLGAKSSNHEEADVLVDEGRIVEIGTGLRSRGSEVIDASEAIVMPGFVDTHHHLARSLFKNLGDEGRETGRGAFSMASAGPDDFYVATLIGLLGAVEAGITTVVDFCEAVSEEQYSAAAEAHRDSGLRTVLVDTRRPTSSVAPDETTPPRAWGASVGDVESESLAAARAAGLRVHLHADRTAGSGGSLDGLLGPDVTVIHGSGLGAGWMNAVRTAGASVALTPASEMAEGAGSPPVQALMDLGIRPGLGVGDERVAPGDMFAQMRALISVQHATYFDLKLAGKGGLPYLLGTRQVIRAGTIDGAEAVGLGPVTGSLEVGKGADIVVLRADRPNIFPINDPIGAVVWGMDTSNIHWVLSGGKALMENGVLSADVGDARRRAVSSRDRIGAAASSAGGGTL